MTVCLVEVTYDSEENRTVAMVTSSGERGVFVSSLWLTCNVTVVKRLFENSADTYAYLWKNTYF